MGVYQRDGRYMVYYLENGKRRDKSFGRGEDARAQAEAFDMSKKQVNGAAATTDAVPASPAQDQS